MECDDIYINSKNSDSNCHRVKISYAKKLVKENREICINCVYSNKFKEKQHEQII